MSFREEDRQKSNCPSRGLGLAAAAIGVGVGAALYYFFSKRPENPDGEGSTASEWQTESLRNARRNLQSDIDEDSDSYSTISEDETTDTTIHTDGDNSMDHDNSLSSDSDSMSEDSLEVNDMSTDDQSAFSEASNSDLSEWDVTDSSMYINEYSFTSTPTLLRLAGNISSLISPRRGNRELTWNNIYKFNYRNRYNSTICLNSSISEDEISDTSSHGDCSFCNSIRLGSSLDDSCEDSDLSDESAMDDTADSPVIRDAWDVLYVDEYSMLHRIPVSMSLIKWGQANEQTEEEQMNILRDQAYRERNWTTEECSICFDVIRRNQEVMTLPCTHNFHQACILPWLQEQQTCPNCRKRTE